MPGIKRRHFLQSAGATLAAIGLSQTNFLRQAHRYGQALAEDTPRKLALLVGINQYLDEAVPNLSGCLTDVDMQYQLLVNRFGFHPDNVMVVSDTTAILPTRANILQAFEEHLIQQAKPGDVVVFHYSGHGSRVVDPDPIVVEQCGADSNPTGLNGTLVPRDTTLNQENGADVIVSDIMGRSLYLLMERVQTENLTVVLDSCFSGAGTRGNARVRSATSPRLDIRSNDARLLPSPEELANQERWLADLKLDQEEFQRRRSRGIAKGVALGSASCNQVAYEQPYDTDQSAGTFTYLLTSYLWQVPAIESARRVQGNLVRSTRIATQNRGRQIPIFEAAPVDDTPAPATSNTLDRPLYFVDALAPFAEGVVRTVTGPQIEVWLGGLSYQTLKTAAPGTVYALLDPKTATPLGEMVLESRNGLLAYGSLLAGQSAEVRPGLLLREKLAAIPNPSLRIGIDPSLATEQAAAETALQTVLQSTSGTTGEPVNRITVLPVNQRDNVEYVLARTSEQIQAQLRQAGVTTVPPLGTIGLYASDLSSVVPNSPGPVNEAAPAAVNRLQLNFKRLLVTQVLQELAGTASDLQVNGEIYTASGVGPTIPIGGRGSQINGSGIQVEPVAAAYPANDLIQIRVSNTEPDAVYLSCLVIDAQGQIIALHPARWDAPDEAARIDRNESLVVPRTEDNVQFRVSGAGFIEVLTLVSKQPLRGLLRNLQTIARGANRSRGAVLFEEGDPVRLVEDLLGDIDGISRSGTATIITETVSTEATAVDAGAIAAFSTVIEIVES